MPSLLRSYWVWIGSCVSWFAIALFIIAQAWLGQRASVRELLPDLESLALWALFTPFIIALSERLTLERGCKHKTLVLHALAALALHCLDVTIDGLLLALPAWSARAIRESFINCYSYAAVAGVGYALVYARASSEARTRAAELQRRFAEARLEALTARLQPHFLFNALNAIAALIRLEEPTKALDALARLGELLRVVIKLDGDARVPLSTELSLVERYLAIEQTRFQDRLHIDLQASEEVASALVPALILQPIVENAIKHGLEQRRGRGIVAVQAERSGELLSLCVRNEADSSMEEHAQPGFGLGLESTRERLAHLYGASGFQLELIQSSQGSVARMQIPFILQEA